MFNGSTDLDGFGPEVTGMDISTIGIELPKEEPYRFGETFHFDPELHSFPPQERPPSLPEVDLQPSSVTFLERLPNGLSEGANSGVFRVNIKDEGERLLKIYHGVVKEFTAFRGGFTREAAAYRNLLDDGACAAGVVPHCYGWATIDPAQWEFQDDRDWLIRFRDDPRPCKALILEYLPNAKRLTLRHTTLERADAAIEALKVIHRARVHHGDTHPRNILLLPDERIVWVDFECAACWPVHRAVNKHILEEELAHGWSWLFQTLIPWKWYASIRWNEQAGQDEFDIESLEQGLVKRGYRIISRNMEARYVRVDHSN